MSLWLRTGLAEPRVALFVGMAYRNLRDPTLDSTKSLILLNILKELRGEFLRFCVPQRFLLRAYPPNVETAALGFPPHPLGMPSEEAGESLARLNLGWGTPLPFTAPGILSQAGMYGPVENFAVPMTGHPACTRRKVAVERGS